MVADFTGVVVAAGSASRFGGPVPKQFCELGGASVLEHSVRGLVARPAVRGVVVVLAADRVEAAEGRAAASWPGVLAVVPGGASRAESVERGLAASGDVPFVLVHDAARPLASASLIDAVIEGTRRHGACVPGLPVADTVKEVDAAGQVVRTVDRTALRLAQTPQGARTDWLREALAAGSAMNATDEAAALEAAGRPVAVVPGERINRKITSSHDLDEARRVLEGDGPPSPRLRRTRGSAMTRELRVGTGFDIHELGAARTLVLGGVEFPGEPGLVGHSDADVVLHAVMDAVLGATAMGDIGVLFPPGQARWKDADSRDLARDVAGRVAARGARVVNVDVMLLAERPKIGPRRDAMRAAIAECFGIEVDRVGLKATTLEKLGALGRAEGIACEAVALVEIEA